MRSAQRSPPARPAGRATVSFYRSLFTNLATAIVLLGGTITALTFLGSQRAVGQLSAIVLEQAIARVELQLEAFFRPPVQRLQLMESWAAAGLLPIEDSRAMNRLLAPLLQSDPYASAVMLADERGREHFLLHAGPRWRSRQMLRDLRSDRAAIAEWSEQQPAPTAAWEDVDYDPRRRPWYRGAVELLQARPGPGAAPPVYWTEPYIFFTARLPGITAARAFRGNDGIVRVAAFDLLLVDVARFTTGLRPSANGKVLVLSDDGRVIGLPSDPRFATAEARQAFVFKQPVEIGLPVVAEALRSLSSRPEQATRPQRFSSDDGPWWAEVRPFRLGGERRLSMLVMMPEADLVGNLRYVQLGIVAVMLASLAVAVVRAARLAHRYSRPIEALARASERISRGDVEAGPEITSPIAEVTRLVDAHEQMRAGLRTLLKLERDLQLARRIQQDTFPAELPALPGFEIDAWNEAAEQTGGDTYDVIGYDPAPGERTPRLTGTRASRAVLLVADATGHGIGPALSVAAVRAMLRMAVRAGEDLSGIIHHLNAQLCADLSEGRFVSAWLGELDAVGATLRSFSCGQGPIVHYRARERACDIVETDTVPLGLEEDLVIRVREPIRMEPGDAFVVASDGVVEATDAGGAAFGTKRLVELVAKRHDASAAALLNALRAELAAFTGAAPPDDDRTVLIVKRTPLAPS